MDKHFPEQKSVKGRVISAEEEKSLDSDSDGEYVGIIDEQAIRGSILKKRKR